jgi:uncharacterized protein (DUF1697 family)
MPRYVAFLRGVSPQNAKMPDLKRCVEATGFNDVVTVLSSGNVVFESKSRSAASIESKLESAMSRELGRSFYPIVRSVTELQNLLCSDPYSDFPVPPNAKRVVSFSRVLLKSKLPLPLEKDSASVLCVRGREAFTAYVPNALGPIFMVLITKAFGDEVTTRTWDTVRKCAAK